jgi:hypothetical protein
LVHYHPEPVDDCPCFEDTIAILSVILGSTLGQWWSVTSGNNTSAKAGLWVHGVPVGILIILGRVIFGA